MREPQTTPEYPPAKEPRAGNRRRLLMMLAVLALAVLALAVGMRSCDSSGCCQCESACQDVSRASECRNICRSGVYSKGTKCMNNRCQ